jgi:hypothetical protein
MAIGKNYQIPHSKIFFILVLLLVSRAESGSNSLTLSSSLQVTEGYGNQTGDTVMKQVLNLKNGVFWDVTPCGSCKNRRFGGT